MVCYSRWSESARLGTTKDKRKIGKMLFPPHRKLAMSPSATSKVLVRLEFRPLRIFTPAPPDPRAGPLARQSPARALQLLRSARQQTGAQHVPEQDRVALVSGASAPQPAIPHDLGAHVAPRCPMATPAPHPTPLARRTLRRQNPREEPSALDALAGICAGGSSNPPRAKSCPYRDSPVPPIEKSCTRAFSLLKLATTVWLWQGLTGNRRDHAPGERRRASLARIPGQDNFAVNRRLRAHGRQRPAARKCG